MVFRRLSASAGVISKEKLAGGFESLLIRGESVSRVSGISLVAIRRRAVSLGMLLMTRPLVWTSSVIGDERSSSVVGGEVSAVWGEAGGASATGDENMSLEMTKVFSHFRHFTFIVSLVIFETSKRYRLAQTGHSTIFIPLSSDSLLAWTSDSMTPPTLGGQRSSAPNLSGFSPHHLIFRFLRWECRS